MANAPQGWRSCRGTEARWKLCEVEALAARLVEVLPEEARGLLRDPRWKGGNIVVIKDQVAWAPKQEDIIKTMSLSRRLSSGTGIASRVHFSLLMSSPKRTGALPTASCYHDLLQR